MAGRDVNVLFNARQLNRTEDSLLDRDLILVDVPANLRKSDRHDEARLGPSFLLWLRSH